MIHDRVDIERWRATFPLGKLREEAREQVLSRQIPHPESVLTQEWLTAHHLAVERLIDSASPHVDWITGPYDIAIAEQMRESIPRDTILDSIPTDVFVFGRGEPAHRCTTKIGGVPYLPTGAEWPLSSSGQPMSFLAQFCFADSTDIVGAVPAGMLLVFGNIGVPCCAEPEEIVTLWTAIDIPEPMAAREVPEGCSMLSPFYGSIHRTCDYVLSGSTALTSDSIHLEHEAAVLDGTKIGGIPKWLQKTNKMPGRFLCSLGSVSPGYQHSFPFLNQANWEAGFDDNTLLWFGDSGTLYFFLDDMHTIAWTAVGYYT